MREFARLVYSEFYKMKHTAFFWLHLLVPVFGILLFLCYYGVSTHKWESELSGYITVLTVSFPLVISIACAQNVSVEEGNHFLVFLGMAVKRRNIFLAKWFVCFFMGLTGIAIAVGGFMAGYNLLLKRGRFDIRFCLMIIFFMWAGSIGMYFLHVFLNLWKPKSISICMGAVESVVSALMLTGLGEGLWQFFPCTYGGHWEGYYLRYCLEGRFPAAVEELRGTLFVNGAVTAGIVLFTLAAFHFYEGRQNND
ncbi:lantibiotic immunity ABC transporter MutG family permease subunit [Lachnospiraceae bacterium 42-17]